MKNLAPNIVKLRICVAFMGEKEQIGWWPSSFLSSSGEAFLSPVFPKTSTLARLKDKYIDSDDEDGLIDKEMRVHKVDYVRTTRKKSIRTNTHKLINKAVANIQAVEKGILGVGH